ncbi:MAG: hypothetical protein IIW78_02585, partial [Clostridia bacterium]|nr:hypothetical protein [Clostridia bacterium]
APFVFLLKSKKAMKLANSARDLPPHARTPNCDTHRIFAHAGVLSPAVSTKKGDEPRKFRKGFAFLF